VRKLVIVFVATVLCGSFVRPATADVILGQQLYYTGGDVSLDILPPSAGYWSSLSLYLLSGGGAVEVAFLGINHSHCGPLVTFDPGTDFGYDVGDELVFGIYVWNTGQTYFMGPGGRNPDELVHATVEQVGSNSFIVGFEDLFGPPPGSDRDFNDNRFLFTGSLATAVSEPGTLALLGLGLLGIGVARRRKAAQTAG